MEGPLGPEGPTGTPGPPVYPLLLTLGRACAARVAVLGL